MENIDYKERLLKAFEERMLVHCSSEETEIASRVLMLVLSDFRVEKEPRDIALLDDYNERILSAYCSCLMIEGKSDQTIKAYKREIRRVGDLLHKNFNKMGTYDLRFYLAAMKNRRCTNTTIENSRSYMSAFFKWMETEGFVQKNPMLPIKPIKTSPKTEEPFLESEIDALRFACKNTKERALIEVAISSGLRREELAALKITDIDLRTREVHVRHGKGDKARISYITELAATCVERYLAERDDELDVLFLSQVGANGGYYTKGGIYKMFLVIGERAGIDNVHPHRFRHTMATNLSERGMPIEQIQQILGHSDLNTTRRYVHTNRSTIEASFRRFSG